VSVIYPELVVGRHDDEARAWTIRRGSTKRGEASCNLTDRILEVPLDSTEPARVVRAHELMHARVSPRVDYLLRALDEASPRSLECAEELRVNTLIGRLGFDVATLCDGTEKIGARRLAEAGQWPEALCFLMAVLGTGAERDFFSGIRQGDPSWLAALRNVRKRALEIFSLDTALLAATDLDDAGLPRGYARSTLVLARLLTQSGAARVPTSAEELRSFRRSLEVGGRRPPTGAFAPLVLDTTLFPERSQSGGRERTWSPRTSGLAMRYPGRLLTDDQRRAFAHQVPRHGGVLVVDQSGSMDVSPEDLRALVREAPHALVIGYSHRPGDRGATPNAWVLCRRGQFATRNPSGNVGNGVDLPALLWAASQRRPGEALVWVTDGQVTDSHDYPDATLTHQCAQFVTRHRIRLVRELSQAATVLRTNRPTPVGAWESFGRVGRALVEIADS
jgi:hypothetical protein